MLAMFPATDALLKGSHGKDVRAFIRHGLEQTDARIANEQPITPMFLYAVMLWPAVEELKSELLAAEDLTEFQARTEAIHRLIVDQQSCTSLPKRFGVPMREVLQMQARFGTRQGVRALRFLEHKRFRAAYDFMLLRADCGEVDRETAEWWTEIQRESADEQRRVIGAKRRGSSSRRGGRKRKRRNPVEHAGD